MSTAVSFSGQSPVLVLNRSWAPLNATTMQRAIKMLIKGRAKVVHPSTFHALTWEDWSAMRPADGEKSFYAAGQRFCPPEVIVLTEYDKLLAPQATFNRRTLFKRDHHRCQYCGKQPGSEELTIDHVIPRSKGGPTSWENCTLCCVDCNRRKANRTPEQAGMKLLSVPKRPTGNLYRFPAVKIDSWEQFLGEAFWSVPLT